MYFISLSMETERSGFNDKTSPLIIDDDILYILNLTMLQSESLMLLKYLNCSSNHPYRILLYIRVNQLQLIA